MYWGCTGDVLGMYVGCTWAVRGIYLIDVMRLIQHHNRVLQLPLDLGLMPDHGVQNIRVRAHNQLGTDHQIPGGVVRARLQRRPRVHKILNIAGLRPAGQALLDQEVRAVEGAALPEDHRDLVAHLPQVVALVGHAADAGVDAEAVAAAQDVHDRAVHRLAQLPHHLFQGENESNGRFSLTECPVHRHFVGALAQRGHSARTAPFPCPP